VQTCAQCNRLLPNRLSSTIRANLKKFQQARHASVPASESVLGVPP
jgi:hypothetical protein